VAAVTLFQVLESGYFMINVSFSCHFLSHRFDLPVLSTEGSQIGKMQEICGLHVSVVGAKEPIPVTGTFGVKLEPFKTSTFITKQTSVVLRLNTPHFHLSLHFHLTSH
jgi:hypothetical protein